MTFTYEALPMRVVFGGGSLRQLAARPSGWACGG